MQPAWFVRVDLLPLNSNGKLDKAALPEPTEKNIWRDQSIVSPQTPVEEHLVAIVSSLVHSSVVSTHDNFFLLGGNSLLGTQVLTRVGEELGVELSLRTLFDYPTIVELAREIERVQPSITERFVIMPVKELSRTVEVTNS
jgi:acyl carrier protein